ncbi:MAG: acyl-CoA desaturase, partial [Steroidobacteraceae bacterium]
MSATIRESARRNWTNTLMFGLTFAVAISIVPWYGIAHGYHAAAWIFFTLFLGANGMSITCGYHRLFAHCTYEAHPLLRLCYLL